MRIRIIGTGRSEAVEDIRSALVASLRAADPERIAYKSLNARGEVLEVGGRTYDLSDYSRILVLGAGKASARMALGVERRIRGLMAGAVIAPEGQPRPKLSKVKILNASHPFTGKKAETATRRLLQVAERPRADDLILCLFSGGGSALMELPDFGIPMGDLRRTTELLMKSGADIHEMNAVRKHLSKVKGGRLAEILYPATILTLVMSDVVGNEPDAIASGPTAPDRTTYGDARRVLERRGIWPRTPPSVKAAIEEGISGVRSETPKPGSRLFSKSELVIVGDNALCRRAASEQLRMKGYRTVSMKTSVAGEARDVGRAFVGRLIKLSGGGRRRAAIVGGGETTVTVSGRGKGGRNQELALASAIAMRGRGNLWVASMGTDGVDGSTDAAGAVASSKTTYLAARVGVDPWGRLVDNDSYNFFKSVGGLIMTGSTGTNLNDIVIGISEGR